MSALSLKCSQRVVRPRFKLKVRRAELQTVLWHDLQMPQKTFISVLCGKTPES